MRTETSRHPRNTLLLAVALSALMAQAAADPLQDCIQDKRARLRLQTCPAVIDSPAYNALEKSTAYANLGELRLQAGTLRFDLNTLIAQKDKTSRKAAEALKKDFLLKVPILSS